MRLVDDDGGGCSSGGGGGALLPSFQKPPEGMEILSYESSALVS